ncbi:MAG: DUF1269 domain-containing protein [Bacteroidota bacterium]|nr:DUF1269 domain-containing protein [Bacteroidota bacterium]
METLTVLKFETADGAEKALRVVQDLSKQNLINLHDAAIVTWPEGKKKPKTEQLHDLKGAGALSGAFWGMLFGLIFFVPLLGLAVGAAMGALTGSMTDIGINDEFIRSVRGKVTEGTSALFLMTSDAVKDRVAEAARGMKFEIIATNLSKEEEKKLHETFAEEETAPAR